MAGKYPTIYQKGRKATCLTQEQAAEALYVSVDTLKDWEQGQRIPSNTAVMQMCELYDTPWLALEHLKETAGMLGVLPGGIQRQSLPTAAITLYNRVVAFSMRYRRTEELLTIAEDGIIDDQERERYEQIVADLDAIISAALQIKFIECGGIKKDHPTGGAVRRSVHGQAKNDCRNIISDSTENASMIFAGKEVSRV